MNTEWIISAAKEAGFIEDANCEIYGSYYHLERFAALVRAEYEKPLKLAEKSLESWFNSYGDFADVDDRIALDAIHEALADHVEQSLTMVADHSGDANEMVYSKPSVFDGVCCGCSKKAADGYALYCVECWEKSNGDPFTASGKPIADHIASADKMVAEPVKHSEHYWLHEINNARADGYERGYAAGKSEPVKQEPVAWMQTVKALTDQCAALIQERDELQKQVWRYEKHGVTCQTYRHKVESSCAECNENEIYAHPVRTKDLTDDEIDEIESKILMAGGEHNDIYRAVIAADRKLNGVEK